MALGFLIVVVFVPMVAEAVLAASNERKQLARGGIRAPGDVHEVMRIVYPAAFFMMIVEGFFRHPPVIVVGTGFVVFVAAKLLKWAAIVSLGSSWTFRVIVIPGAALVARGPYRYVRHPNYVAVVGELVGTALMTGAFIAGPIGIVGFLALLRMRIGVEERALARLTGAKSAR